MKTAQLTALAPTQLRTIGPAKGIGHCEQGRLRDRFFGADWVQ